MQECCIRSDTVVNEHDNFCSAISPLKHPYRGSMASYEEPRPPPHAAGVQDRVTATLQIGIGHRAKARG
jgi:hypothetical protein